MKEVKGSIKGTKTEQNLMNAFVGECMASVKYGFYASKAKKDGFIQMQHIFTETSSNEAEHAKIWFKYLYGEFKDTMVNLDDAANGEMYEYNTMYPEFAKDAQDEGFVDIAAKFRMVANIENQHGERYVKLAKNIENNRVFSKDEPVEWICQNCGHIHVGTNALEICPVCNHSSAYFEVRTKNY